VHTVQGISLDTWASLTAECAMSAELVGGQAQIQLGHASGSLCLVTNEAGLAKLLRLADSVLTQWRASDDPKGAAFSTPDEQTAELSSILPTSAGPTTATTP